MIDGQVVDIKIYVPSKGMCIGYDISFLNVYTLQRISPSFILIFYRKVNKFEDCVCYRVIPHDKRYDKSRSTFFIYPPTKCQTYGLRFSCKYNINTSSHTLHNNSQRQLTVIRILCARIGMFLSFHWYFDVHTDPDNTLNQHFDNPRCSFQ